MESASRVFSNGPKLKDFVINPFTELICESSSLLVAAPFVSKTEELVEAAKAGKSVKLIVGLNTNTSPEALQAAQNIPNLEIKYFTGSRFHAKMYIADEAALVGSSNLTKGGLSLNREATILLEKGRDTVAMEELRTLFGELWQYADPLTPAKLAAFATKSKQLKHAGTDPDELIAAVVGASEPPNVNFASTKKTSGQIFLKELQHLVYGQYRPAFVEVMSQLEANSYRRSELSDLDIANETNLFLSWVRLTYAPGDEWASAPLRSEAGRRAEIDRLGPEWISTDQSWVSLEYRPWLEQVRNVFGTKLAVTDASKDELTMGLTSIHAFSEQLRFVKGGMQNLPGAFWGANNDDVDKVRKTLTYLLYGDSGDFTVRLHDVLYDSGRKLSYFGKFCALELYGTIKPMEFPQLNGRIAKGLRFLGFEVPGE